MSLDMWWKDDIRNVLQGVAMVAPHMARERDTAERLAFQEGYMAALSAVAVSLGIAVAHDTPRSFAETRSVRLLDAR